MSNDPVPTPASPAPLLTRSALFCYGLFGLPLALVALPIYVYVPQFYAEHFGLALTFIGSTLLIARLLDALIDPLCGLWIDRAKGDRGYAYFILLSLLPLITGFIALFHVPESVHTGTASLLTAWLWVSLLLVYSGFSIASVAYQSWGAALTQQRQQRVRLTGMREACGLTGVVLAAAIPSVAGMDWLTIVFVGSLLVGAVCLVRRAPRPVPSVSKSRTDFSTLWLPFGNRRFRWLLGVFVMNGIAAAIPATLFLFFAKDALQLGAYAGFFLILYFVAAAATLPIWVLSAKRYGEARMWLVSIGLAVMAFIWVAILPTGAMMAFSVICVLSGMALGADLALPPALLAAVIADASHEGKHEGAYFGIWNWATKINLALAAGIALPLLERLGYSPGLINDSGVSALRVGYALLPCVLKILAALILWRAPLKHL